ncbi:MAG: fumarylacetoacetate hydrolase family protein [Chloroflexi bacterium OLB15]|nr:MAG: fumarylacetoacetate hydrolase family protein [Chloroflexi bacterium OLB15]
MKLLTFTVNGRTRIGELVGDTVYALAWQDNMRQMIRRGIVANRAYERFPLDAVKVEAPLIPSKIICIGLNYADHAKETGAELPKAPVIFAKFPSAIIAQGEQIKWKSEVTSKVDWEAELVVVIGKVAKDVSEEDALNYVFGYTVGNDVSARDLQKTIDVQWTRGKSLDTFAPLGPVIVTRDEIEDPQALKVTCKVNDTVMQDGTTADMIFNVKQLVSYCSQMFTLQPGDLIMTGTPAGVGAGRKPARFLKDGDTVTITIEGVGELSNQCVVIEK